MFTSLVGQRTEQEMPPAVSSIPDFRALFESAPGLYVVMMPSFEIIAVSDAYLAATRTTRAEIVGRDFFEVFAGATHDRTTGSARGLTASLQRVLSERRTDVMPIEKLDVRSPWARGVGADERPWSRVNSPVFGPDGEVRYIVHRIEDVSESIRLKEDFLAMLGHELRNPLAAIASATEILKRVGAVTGTAGQSRAVIERQVRHLKRLVDDLLDAARVQGGKVTLERRPVDLAEALQHALATVQGASTAPHHAVDLDVEPMGVNVDPVRLEQILVSLLTNAVKFTPAGRAIRVRVRAEGDSAVLVVQDDGIGMPEEILPRIFDLFFQGERSAARTEGGLGIGLTLVKTLTELHGGSVEAASAGRGHGSTFVVRLPRAVTPSTSSRRPSRAHNARRRVLLVEDNDDAREMLRTWLTLDGHDVLEAANGIEAVKILASERPDVAFIDIGLPEMDGYEVARTTRRQTDQSTLLVALTGYGQAEDHQRCFDAGFDDFVLKPVDPARLTQILADRTAALRW
jgi:signal transduction histidine kinase/ActR/RegA family two-component response regulator